MAGRKRLLLGDITQSKLRGPALIKAIGELDRPSASYEDLASGYKKASKKQHGTSSTK